MASIIYVLGIIAAIWCVIDIFKKSNVNILVRILLALAVLAFSWIGFAVYYFLIRKNI